MMFSKFGKILKYQFHILHSKDQILSQKKPKKRIKRLPKYEKESSADNESTKPVSPKSQKQTNSSHMFRSQSREDFYKNQSKSVAPPVGYYNCRYTYITKSPKSAIFKLRKKTSSRVQTPKESPVPFNSHVPKTRVPSINFEKQIPRPNIFIKPVNENRFVSFQNMPEVCSNFKRTGTPDIRKMSGRREVVKSSACLSTYNADFKLVQEDLGKVHEFQKYTSRKPLFNDKEDLREYEINWKSVEKKHVSVDFSKSCSKFKIDESS